MSEGEWLIFGVLFGLNGLVIGLGFLLGFARHRLYSVFWAAALALHVSSLISLEGDARLFQPGTLLFGQGLMLLGNGGLGLLLAAVEAAGRARPAEAPPVRPHVAWQRYFILTTGLWVLALALRLREGNAILFSNWALDRQAAGWPETLSNLIAFLVYPSIWIAVRRRKVWLVAGLGFLGLLLFQIAGSRAMLLTLVCAAYIDLLAARRAVWQKLAVLLLLGVFAFGLHTASRFTRGLGAAEFFALTREGRLVTYLQELPEVDPSGGESRIYSFYYYVVERGYTFYPYRSGVTLYRLATLFAPRQMLPEKPIDITTQFWLDIIQDGYYGTLDLLALRVPGSVHATLWGDAYASHGAPGAALYSLFFGLILLAFERLYLRLSPIGVSLLAPMIAAAYLMLARGNVVVGLGWVAYTFPIVLAGAWLTRQQLLKYPPSSPPSPMLPHESAVGP